jgi:hypothetical protein
MAIAPQRRHVHATCSGSSFMITGHPQAWGGHGCSPSAIHHTAWPIDREGRGLNSGPSMSVRRRTTRATPRGFTGSGRSSRSARPSRPSRHGTTAFRQSGTAELSSADGCSASATARRSERASRRRVFGAASCLARRAQSSDALHAPPSASSRSSFGPCQSARKAAPSRGDETGLPLRESICLRVGTLCSLILTVPSPIAHRMPARVTPACRYRASASRFREGGRRGCALRGRACLKRHRTGSPRRARFRRRRPATGRRSPRPRP